MVHADERQARREREPASVVRADEETTNEARPHGRCHGVAAAQFDARSIHDPKVRALQIVRLIAKMPTLAALSYRHSLGMPYVYPDNHLHYTGNLLNMMFKMADLKYKPSSVLEHALDVLRALRAHEDSQDAGAAYRASVMPALTERYELATALDEQRLRLWTGAPADFSRRETNYELFSVYAAAAVAMVDPEVFRVFVRRMGLLDSTRVLDEDEGLKQRIEVRFRQLVAQPRPAPGPTRDEMLALIHAAMES